VPFLIDSLYKPLDRQRSSNAGEEIIVGPTDWATNELSKNWSLVVSAPAPFIATLVLGFAAGWLGIGSLQRQRMKFWQKRVSEYKDKLNNASPTEVASRISSLENDLAKTKTALMEFNDRRITPIQRTKFPIISASVSREEFSAFITCDPFNPEADVYAKQLMDLFRSNGFIRCTYGHYQVPKEFLEIPLALVVSDPAVLPPNAQIAIRLFDEIGIKYQVVRETRQLGNPQPNLFYIVVGRKRIDI
jgi:hypothetical protein